MRGWIGVDLDGTLARYDGWRGPEHIGEPHPPMVERVRSWLDEGQEVRIFTARAHDPEEAAIAVPVIHEWLAGLGLPPLPVTCTKDPGMIELWDDRAVQVDPLTGDRAFPVPF